MYYEIIVNAMFGASIGFLLSRVFDFGRRVNTLESFKEYDIERMKQSITILSENEKLDNQIWKNFDMRLSLIEEHIRRTSEPTERTKTS